MIALIGMGPGHIRYLTQEAIDTLRSVDCRIAFGRIAETARQIVEPVVEVHTISEIARHIPPGLNSAILASGDACFYGILDYLQRNGIVIDHISPGLSSFQYMMAKLQRSWSQATLVSLHGREEQFEKIINHPLSVVLTDKKHSPGMISLYLKEHGIQGKMYIGYNLSYENEQIEEVAIGEAIEDNSWISVVVVEHEMAER